MGTSRRYLSIASTLLLLVASVSAHAVPWFPFGPFGGDARALVADPKDPTHLYLGTATGVIYESHDEGQEWKRLVRLDRRDDLILDNIEVDDADAKHILVGAHAVDRPDGGLYTSKDGGATWHSDADMKGQSIRALTQSLSDSKVWVAGTLSGVYRSDDSGEHWKPISPAGSTEIHEVESVAIDPINPLVIYAGTWHLPWKTTDGGEHWASIKEGVIDDSDVFSIIVDPAHPATVYASACSGIYKSDNAGARFQKVEGIPSTARRTRVLMQDPSHHDTVFAGTTEGLWRTGNGGKIWLRITSPDVIVNDVYVDPTNSNKLLLATDRSGVLASDDGGASFYSANKGFAARHLSSFVQDAHHPATVYVGALNDKQYGGVFASSNGGITWVQQSSGLAGSDVFSMGQAPDGTILAGTAHGLYRLSGSAWTPVPEVLFTKSISAAVPRAAASAPASKHPVARKLAVTKKTFDGAVFAIVTNDNSVFVASSQGLLVSHDSGGTWKGVERATTEESFFLASARSYIVTAGIKSVSLSKDSGTTWKSAAGPSQVSQITAVAVDDDGIVWVGGREGVFYSPDNGASWTMLDRASVNDVNSLTYDPKANRILVTQAGTSTMAYTIQLPQRQVGFHDTGWNLRFVRPVGDHMLAVTPFDGVVLEPRMVDSGSK